MEVLFGTYHKDEAETLGLDTWDMFKSPDGPHFSEYKLEMLSIDTITLKDSVGRLVPIAFCHLDQFIKALTILKNTVEPYVTAMNNSREILRGMKIDS